MTSGVEVEWKGTKEGDNGARSEVEERKSAKGK